MATLVKFLLFAASPQLKNTSVKLVNPKFADKTVWLNLKTPDNKPDFGAQRVIAEILRGTTGSGSHYEVTIHREEILQDEKGNLSVSMTPENLKSRWDMVLNAGPSESESAARELFAEELNRVKTQAPNKAVAEDSLPF